MKYSFSLISKLYTLSLLWFGLTIVASIFYLANIFFQTHDFKIQRGNATFGGNNNFRNGYDVPAKINIQMPADTFIKFEKNNTRGGLNLYKNEDFGRKYADSILKDTSLKKFLYFSQWIPMNFESDEIENSKEFIDKNEVEVFAIKSAHYSKKLQISPERSYSLDCQIKIRTKSIYKNFLLSLNVSIGLFALLLVSFQFMKIFKNLYLKISFLSSIHKRLYISGIVIISSEIIKFILSIIYSKWYSGAMLLKAPENLQPRNFEFYVTFNPRLDFSLSIFLLGLCIIVLSYVFKYGNKIEQENILTV